MYITRIITYNNMLYYVYTLHVSQAIKICVRVGAPYNNNNNNNNIPTVVPTKTLNTPFVCA